MTITFGIEAVDRVLPGGAFTSPAAGNVAGAITLQVSVTDNDQVASVQFRVDGANIGSPVGSPWSTTYETRNLLNGAHTFTAVITDRLGNQTTVSRAVTFANAPVVAITSPGNGGSYAGNWAYSANVTHYSSSATTRFYIDGGLNNTLGGGGALGYTFDSHYLSAGWHSFQVITTDAQGNTGQQTFSAHVANSTPGAGYAYFGDMMVWWGAEGEEGYYEYRTSPGGDWFADTGNGPWYWAGGGEGAGRYWAVGIPGNPDPTHYQMYAQGYGGYVEGGSDGNVVRLGFWINGGGPYEWWANGNTGAYWGVGGGDAFQCGRYATSPGWNTCHCADVRVYYWFGLKPGYAS